MAGPSATRKPPPFATFRCHKTDLRSFLELVNQCSSFLESVSELSTPLRPLLKTRNEFAWDASHSAAFEAVKSALVSPPVLAHFELGRPLRLETDASVLHGLGYILWQQQRDNQWHLLECGSRFLSDVERKSIAILRASTHCIQGARRKFFLLTPECGAAMLLPCNSLHDKHPKRFPLPEKSSVPCCECRAHQIFTWSFPSTQMITAFNEPPPLMTIANGD